jgi:hypothetical protein
MGLQNPGMAECIDDGGAIGVKKLHSATALIQTRTRLNLDMWVKTLHGPAKLFTRKWIGG